LYKPYNTEDVCRVVSELALRRVPEKALLTIQRLAGDTDCAETACSPG